MKKGNISNVSAPYIYIDGISLFETSFFGVKPKEEYIKKLIGVLREMNVIIFLESSGKINERDLVKAEFPYSDVIKTSIEKFRKYLQKERILVYANEERSKLFSGNCALLSANVKDMLMNRGEQR